MEVKKHIKMDLSIRDVTPIVYAVQGDTNTRTVEFALYDGGLPWTVPDGSEVLIRFRTAKGTGGIYDTLPDGTAAYSVSDNVVTVALAPAVLAVAGMSTVQVAVTDGDSIVAAYAIAVSIQEDPAADAITPEDYVNMGLWITAELAKAKASGDFNGPKGDDGITPNIKIGTVETLPAGSSATASMTGTPENPLLNLGIPQGQTGSPDYLLKSGGTMSGPIHMNGNAISGLSTPTVATGAATKAYADSRNRRNLLDNSDFRNPVNQRGARSYSGSVYSIDRWRQWSAESTCTVQDGYVTCSGTNLQQYLKYYDPDKIYTVAACAIDGTIWALSGKFADAPNDAHFNLDVSSAGYATVGLKAGSWVWAALYEGEYTAETLPAYQPKGYAAELLECQRYYLKPISQAIGFASSETTALIPINTPVQMRTTPTVSGTINWFRTEGAQLAASSVANAAFASSLPAGNAIVITLSGLTGLTAHKAVYLAVANFELSADL